MNIFTIIIIITAIMLIFILSILTCILLMLLSDLYYNTIYFILEGDPILYQHLFWYFGHPEVYILILPSFGIINQILSVFIIKLTFGFFTIISAINSILILGNIVWGHHIYIIGLEIESKLYYTILTLIIAVPTGTKIYNWLSLYLGSYNFLEYLNIYLLFTLIFINIFNIGGITGIILGNNIIDLTLHDTYYVIAHFHYILSIGAIISLISSILYFIKILNLDFFILFNKFNYNLQYFIFIITFTPLYFIGYNIMPRRLLEFSEYYNSWNYLSSISSKITIITFILLFLLKRWV
jgi:cytochrome c oxidase subunit 1